MYGIAMAYLESKTSGAHLGAPCFANSESLRGSLYFAKMLLGDSCDVPHNGPFEFYRYFTEEIQTNPLVVSLACLLYTSPSPRDEEESRMPSSA